jgi:hypothetical protein
LGLVDDAALKMAAVSFRGMGKSISPMNESAETDRGGNTTPVVCKVLAPRHFQAGGSEESWRKFLQERKTESELRAIRRGTYSGRPLRPEAFTPCRKLPWL